MPCAEPSTFGVEGVGGEVSEATSVEMKGVDRGVWGSCGVLGVVVGTALGVHVPKNLRIQRDLPSTYLSFIWNISVSFGIRGFDANGRLPMICKQYPNSPSMIMPAASSPDFCDDKTFPPI